MRLSDSFITCDSCAAPSAGALGSDATVPLPPDWLELWYDPSDCLECRAPGAWVWWRNTSESSLSSSAFVLSCGCTKERRSVVVWSRLVGRDFVFASSFASERSESIGHCPRGRPSCGDGCGADWRSSMPNCWKFDFTEEPVLAICGEHGSFPRTLATGWRSDDFASSVLIDLLSLAV